MEHSSISSAKPSYHGVSKLGGKELRILSFRKILEIFFFRLLIVTRVLLISILFSKRVTEFRKKALVSIRGTKMVADGGGDIYLNESRI